MIRTLTRYWVVATTAAMLSVPPPTLAQPSSISCGDLQNLDYGPFDYRLAAPDERQLVEGTHFTPDLEYKLQSIRTRPPAEDVDYTLRAFPNHPRALLTMTKLSEKEKTEKPRGARWSVECYFDRAIRFQPDDGNVRLVYGIYLSKRSRGREAIEQLEKAEQLVGSDANVHYNLGLAYFDGGDMKKALSHAHDAYRLGFPLPGLRNKLERAGKWSDPQVTDSPQTPPASVPK